MGIKKQDIVKKDIIDILSNANSKTFEIFKIMYDDCPSDWGLRNRCSMDCNECWLASILDEDIKETD